MRPFAYDRPDEVAIELLLPDVADEVDGPPQAQGFDGLEEGAAADFDDVVDAAVVRLRG